MRSILKEKKKPPPNQKKSLSDTGLEGGGGEGGGGGKGGVPRQKPMMFRGKHFFPYIRMALNDMKKGQNGGLLPWYGS